jgi:hypothetical protein
MKYRITGQMSSGVFGQHPHDFIVFVDIDEVVEANDEYDALEKMSNNGPELYLCRDLVIQPMTPPSVTLSTALLGTLLPGQRRHDVVGRDA